MVKRTGQKSNRIMKAAELKRRIIERLDKSFNNHWHSTTDLIKESIADDIIKIFKNQL